MRSHGILRKHCLSWDGKGRILQDLVAATLRAKAAFHCQMTQDGQRSIAASLKDGIFLSPGMPGGQGSMSELFLSNKMLFFLFWFIIHECHECIIRDKCVSIREAVGRASRTVFHNCWLYLVLLGTRIRMGGRLHTLF